MATLAIATWRAAVLGRWTARILGTLTFLMFLAFVFGEGPPNPFKITNTEKLQFFGMIALFCGLVLAWKWEGLGGFLSVAGFVLLAALGRSHLTMWAFCLPAAIGLVHTICWERLRIGSPPGMVPWHLSRPVIAALLSALALFLVLCANEIFGNPPLMTPSLHPSPPLAGAWHAPDVMLTIHPDASVTGKIRGSAVTGARIACRRSWFGGLMHWNSEYMIVGELDGNVFTIGLWRRGERLFGSLYAGGQPRLLELSKP
jgi:hypothetical protein